MRESGASSGTNEWGEVNDQGCESCEVTGQGPAAESKPTWAVGGARSTGFGPRFIDAATVEAARSLT
jgi:hypothetical protein